MDSPPRPPEEQPQQRSHLWGLPVLWFILHTVTVYVIVSFFTPRLAGWISGTLFRVLQQPGSDGVEFLFPHLFALSFIPAFAAGFINARFRHKAAQYVWVLPAAVLAYKLASFHSVPASVLAPHSNALWAALRHYVGGEFDIPHYRNWQEFAYFLSNPDRQRGMEQLRFTDPFYAGAGYGFAAWLCIRTGADRSFMQRLRQWEDWKFGTGESLVDEPDEFFPADEPINSSPDEPAS